MRTRSPQRKRISFTRTGEILLRREGLCQPHHLDEALAYQRANGGRLGHILVKLGVVTEPVMEHAVVSILSTQYGFPYMPLEHYDIDPAVIRAVPQGVAEAHCLIPVDRTGNNLTIAMADPLNAKAIEELERLTQCAIQAFISTPTDIRSAIARYYRKTPAERGFVMLLVLPIVLLFTLLGSAAMLRGLHNHALGQHSVTDHQAFSLAEAAVDHAISNMTVAIFDDLNNVGLSSGTYTAYVIDPTEDPSLSGLQRRIIGHGEQSATHVREVEVLTQLTPVSVFGPAMLGDEQVVIRGNVLTDSYDSRDGTYGEPLTDENGNPLTDANGDPLLNQGSEGDVATNSTAEGGMDIGGSAIVDGQLVTGAGSDPDVVVDYHGSALEVTADPDATTLAAPIPLPPVIVPEGLTCEDRAINDAEIVALTPGDHCFARLRINGGGTLTTDGTGSVRVFVTQSFSANGNTVIGVQADPTAMIVMLASPTEADMPDALITGTSHFYGGFYAPDADVAIRGTADIYGSVVANRIVVSGTATVHYDEAMSEVTDPVSGYQVSVSYWRDRDAAEIL